MKMWLTACLFLGALMGISSPSWAVEGTQQIPTCMTFPAQNGSPAAMKPCDGSVPVGLDGNPLDWNTIIKGSASSPNYTTLINNGQFVSSTNPLPIYDTSNASTNGTLNTPAPTSARLFAGKDGSGRLQAVSVDSAGIVQVNCPNCTGGSASNAGGSNSAAFAVGTTSPNYASYTAYLGTDNNLHGMTGDNAGHIGVSIFGVPTVTVGNFPAVQAITASSLPLPTGATTATGQQAIINTLNTISSNTQGIATAAGQQSIVTAINAPTPAGNNLIGNVGGVRLHWSEGTSPLIANGVLTGYSRDDGGDLSGTPTKYNTFGCFAMADQIGNLNLQASNDNTTWFTVQSQEVDPGISTFLTQSIFTKYWRCQMVNGGTAENTLVLDSMLGN